MSNRPNDSAIGFARPEHYLQARQVFESAGYSEAGILDYLGGRRPASPIAVDIPPLVLPAKGGSNLEILLRLFLVGMPGRRTTLMMFGTPGSILFAPRSKYAGHGSVASRG